jgi:hypothetical protein
MEPLAFCTRCYTCKKHTFLLSKGPSIGSPLFFCMWCYACKNYKFLLSKGPPIKSLFAFVRGATRVKSMMVRDIN